MARKQSETGPGSVTDLERVEKKAVLLDALPGCIFLIDADHTVVAINAAVRSLLGDDDSTVIGKSLKSVMSPLTDSEGNPLDVDSPVDRCLASGEAELLEAWVRHSINGSADNPEELTSASVSVLPVTATGHTNQVAVVIGGEAVRQPYALRDAVLSMVSHELRTPLLHIKGFVSTLLESDIEWDEETRLDFLHTIDREADRLTSMVNDLMEITRMGSVDLPLHLDDADPYLLAYAAVDSASPFISKHRVLVEIPEDLPKIRMDVLRVRGVLVNLLQNSSKYSELGSKIIIDATTTDSAVTFSVTDEGTGIPKETHNRIFSMFFRGENAAKASSGSGLGLAVCKSVVDAHGGEIWVESTPGKGATFKFTIPFKPPLESSLERQDSRAVRPRARRVGAKKRGKPSAKRGRATKAGKVAPKTKRNRRVAVAR